MTSYGSHHPTGNGPLYIDSAYSCFSNFQPKKFHMKNRKIRYEIWDTSRVFCTSDITSPDSTPISHNQRFCHLRYHFRPNNIKIKFNLIQYYPTRSRFKLVFKKSYEIPNPNRSANHLPTLTRLTIFFTYNGRYHEKLCYT
jgi:hypothetical protein